MLCLVLFNTPIIMIIHNTWFLDIRISTCLVKYVLSVKVVNINGGASY